MDFRSFPGENHSSVDTSFQINPGLCADQSQLNDLEFDLDDAFDELNHHNDPFATPFSVSNNKLTETYDLTMPSCSVTPSQSTSLPNFSPNRTSEAQAQTQPPNPPISNASIPKISEQPAPDDFFHIRKRNSNGRIGVDLTSKSTARLWKNKDKTITPEEFEAIVQSKLSFSRQSVSSPAEPAAVSAVPAQPDPPVVENSVVPAESTSNLKDSEAVKDTGVAKSRLMKPKSISRFSKSGFSSTTARTIGHAAKIPGIKKQGSNGVETIKQAERRKSNGSLISIGGGLIDTLLSYGEKIRNSLGLSSNTPPDPEEPTQSAIMQEPPMNNEPLSPTSPREVKATLSPSSPTPNAVDATTQGHVEETVMGVDQSPPMRTSRKRLLPLSPGRERKRKCLQDENANAHRRKFVSSHDDHDEKKAFPVNKGQKENILRKTISRPKPLRASRNINKPFAPSAHNKPKSLDTEFGTGRIAPVRLPSRGTSTIISKSVNNPIPDSQPLFASDVYQQLALEKAQRESGKSNVRFAKPVPPARPALRPTIPAAFVFRSEERVALRHAEADEKPKAEEAKRDGHSAPHASSKPIHTSDGERVRKKQPNAILSADAPVLNTMIRAKAREKFDNERKEREKILELQRLIRERERAEREEREYREARKRTIPWAHEVPEWYKEAPHKQKYTE